MVKTKVLFRDVKNNSINNIQQGTDRKAAPNSGLAKVAVSLSADIFVVKESSVLRINICAEKPAHRKSANRCATCYKVRY